MLLQNRTYNGLLDIPLNAEAMEKHAAELAALVSASRAAGQREPQTVVAMHISQNNNEYSLAKRTLEAALAEANCAADVLCGYQARLTSVR